MRELQNSELLLQFQKLVNSERKITAEVLKYIAEIDRRKLYLEKAFGSLYEFLTKGHGYSNGAAMRRIEAARLLREVPEVAAKIQNGEVNLSQLAVVQRAAKEHLKGSGQRLELAKKKELLQKICGTTQRQTKVLLQNELNIELQKPIQKQVNHRDESVTLAIKLTKEQMLLAIEARNLLSHIVPDGEWGDILEYLFRKEIEKRKTTKGHSAPAIKKQLLAKDACCRFVDAATGKKCGSQLRLELEHIRPRWAGGSDEPENLTLLCAQHNRDRYKKQANRRTG